MDRSDEEAGGRGGELKKQLEQKGISEAEKLAIRQQLFGLEQSLKANQEAQTAQLPLLTNTHWLHRVVHFVGFTGFGSIGFSWWYLLPRYTSWRHTKCPYSQRQLNFRKSWLKIELPNPAPRRLAGNIAVVLGTFGSWVEQRLKWWRKNNKK